MTSPGAAPRLRFSVFVPTLLRPELLRRNLDALAAQTRAPDEILVSLRPDLDPAGVAVVKDFAAQHPRLTVRPVLLDAPGIVAAENALLAAARGDVACLLDDDAIARPRWLEHLARHYEADPRVGGVAGPAINVVDGAPDERRARFRNRVLFPGLVLDQSTRHTARAVRVDHFRGANMSLRIAPLRAHGGFERRLLGDCFRFELDACLGVARQGFRLIFDPAVEADHHEAPRIHNTGRFQPETIHNNAANETFVLLKHYGPLGRACHLVFAWLVGNFPCPGLAWGVVGTLLRPFWPSRYLLGVGAIGPAWRGRARGRRLWRESRAAPGGENS
jgi:GT2 family glycosyltransferase